MPKQEIKKRIEKLKAEINHHRHLYHVEDKTEISDDALDSLKNELFKLEREYPEFITSDSPTQRIGGKALEKFSKVEHSRPMLSLFDAFSEEDMRDWEMRISKITCPQCFATRGGRENQKLMSLRGAKRRSNPEEEEIATGSPRSARDDKKLNYFCEIKLDGLAVALRYEKGIFRQGATRGDGKIGEEVTHNLKTIESIPLKLRKADIEELKNIGFNEEQIKNIFKAIEADELEVRGEVIMSKNTLKELNEKYKKIGKPLLANPRNAAAGSIRQLDPKLSAQRRLEFYAYDIVTDLGFKYQQDKYNLAKLLGFKVVRENKFCKSLDEVIRFHEKIEKERENFPFYFDGLVVKVNDLSLWKELGIVGKGPRYMMAYKFAGEQATSKLLDLVWQVGRTGILTPTAVLEPVKVGGVTISRATLHNMDEIGRLGLKIGDTVIVERAGDVIPKIIQALPKLRTGREKEIKAPAACPMCVGKVEKVKGEVAYRCANKDCYAVNFRRLAHWASKSAVDIDGLGPKIIEHLMKEGLVRNIDDFYNLTVGDLKPLERFADKSADNLIKSIQAKKEIDLARFIFGLGIRHVGEETASLLAKQITNSQILHKFTNKNNTSISLILKFYQNQSLEELEKLPDVGPIVAKSIYDWFQDKKNIELLERLEKSGVTIEMPKLQITNYKLQNKSFVLTGTLESLSRDEAKEKIRKAGGKVLSSVSKKADYLVAGLKPGSKYDEAKKAEVKIISEKEFLIFFKN